MAVFGVFISYFLSTLAALKAAQTHETWQLAPWISKLASVVCIAIIGICIHKILISGFSYIFLVLIALGIGSMLMHRYKVISISMK